VAERTEKLGFVPLVGGTGPSPQRPRRQFGWRAWKTFPWEATDGLYERGLIDDPRSKAKSVALTDEGARQAEQLFTELFEVDDAETD
jgi:hypothetical protein